MTYMPKRRPRRAPTPLSATTLGRLVRVVGCRQVGYGVEVHGLLGTDELQTKSLPLARHLCRAVRSFVRTLPPARQHRAFDQQCLRLALLGRQP